MVATRDYLSNLSAIFSGQQWRWGRGPQWHPSALRLSNVARHRRDLDCTHLSIPDGRLRLRQSFSILFLIIHPIDIRGLPRVDPHKSTRKEIGTFGATEKVMANCPIIGFSQFGGPITDYCSIDPAFGTIADFDALLYDAHQRGLKAGRSTPTSTNTICIAFLLNNPTWIGVIQKCAMPCFR
jgi:hypothetical protein